MFSTEVNCEIVKATMEDLDRITELESLCFPQAEAATKSDFEKRLKVYPNHFFVAKYHNNIISMVNGLVTDQEDLVDEMYSEATYHNEKGSWQMIFGVDTHPDYRCKGIASKVIQSFIAHAKEEKRAGVVLTCKEDLISFYQKFGFKNEGVSKSEHGGVEWYQMRLVFPL